MGSRTPARISRVDPIVVVALFGLLGAVALPQVIGAGTEARVAAVKRMGGALRSAANMAHEVCMAQGCPNGGEGIVIEGQSIVFENGYPSAASIHRLVRSQEGFTLNASGNRFTKSDARTDMCWVQYNPATVVNGAVRPPTITYHAGQVTDTSSETAVNDVLRQQC